MSNYFLNGSGKLLKFDAHKTPVFKEVKASEFIQYGYSGEWRNRYPDYLLELYNRSAKNNAIINGKNKYIVGNGWTFKSDGLNFNKKTELQAFIKKLEQSKITRNLSLDRTIFGGFACEIIPSNDFEKITLAHIDFSKIRQFKTQFDKDGNKLDTRYAYTSNWGTRRPQENEDFETLYAFDWDSKKVEKDKRYIVYYKDYRPDLGIYPLPDYMGAITYIEADYEIGNFVLNNVKNGFSSSYLVNFYNGEPTEKQKAEIKKRWKKSKQGTDNAGDPILSFNEDKESGVEISPLPSNGQDDRYINLNKQIQTEIFTGHNFNPSILGITDGNGFNNNAGEIRVASEIFQNTYVKTEQKNLEDFINSVAKFNELPEVLSIIKLDVITQELSENVLTQILSTNELREKIGYTALKNNFESEKDFSFEDYFKNCGTDDSNFEFLDSRELMAIDINDANTQADKFKSDYFANKESLNVLGLLNKGLNLTEIKKTLNINDSKINDLLKILVDENLINESNDLTEKGKSESEKNDVFVVYKYVLRNDAPKLLTESRNFCTTLVAESISKSWTRQDINALNNEQLPDVFKSRGGFYNNPETGITTPFCRHVWQQRLVRLK